MTVQEAQRPDCPPTDAPQNYAPSPVPKPVIAFFAVCRKVLGRAEDSRETIREPPTIKETGTWNIEVIVEPDRLDGGFVAETPDIHGAMAQGDTEEEALENLVDAVQGIVAAKMEENFRTLDFAMRPGDVRRISIHL